MGLGGLHCASDNASFWNRGFVDEVSFVTPRLHCASDNAIKFRDTEVRRSHELRGVSSDPPGSVADLPGAGSESPRGTLGWTGLGR